MQFFIYLFSPLLFVSIISAQFKITDNFEENTERDPFSLQSNRNNEIELVSNKNKLIITRSFLSSHSSYRNTPHIQNLYGMSENHLFCKSSTCDGDSALCQGDLVYTAENGTVNLQQMPFMIFDFHELPVGFDISVSLQDYGNTQDTSFGSASFKFSVNPNQKLYVIDLRYPTYKNDNLRHIATNRVTDFSETGDPNNPVWLEQIKKCIIEFNTYSKFSPNINPRLQDDNHREFILKSISFSSSRGNIIPTPTSPILRNDTATLPPNTNPVGNTIPTPTSPILRNDTATLPPNTNPVGNTIPTPTSPILRNDPATLSPNTNPVGNTIPTPTSPILRNDTATLSPNTNPVGNTIPTPTSPILRNDTATLPPNTNPVGNTIPTPTSPIPRNSPEILPPNTNYDNSITRQSSFVSTKDEPIETVPEPFSILTMTTGITIFIKKRRNLLR